MLLEDAHSQRAITGARVSGLHLVSSLAAAEVHAVIARNELEQQRSSWSINDAREAFKHGPWKETSDA